MLKETATDKISKAFEVLQNREFIFQTTLEKYPFQI